MFRFSLYMIAIIWQDVKNVASTPKKGLAVGPWKEYFCGDISAFPDATWWYDWTVNQFEHTKLKHCANKPHAEYIPMIWGESQLRTDVIPRDANYVLGFNEPNVQSQSNMSAQRVAELWPEVEKKAVGKKLISPAAAGCYDGNHCIKWFEEFFAACKGCRFDALAVHSYGCDANHAINSLNAIGKHFNKKLWLTEFACHTATTSEEQLSFLKKFQPMLESSHYIERYAWFVTRLNVNDTFINTSIDLLERQSSTLNQLGRFYNELGHNGIIG